jgi:hypothetical protein
MRERGRPQSHQSQGDKIFKTGLARLKNPLKTCGFEQFCRKLVKSRGFEFLAAKCAGFDTFFRTIRRAQNAFGARQMRSSIR